MFHTIFLVCNDLHFIQCACKFTDTCSTCGGENTSKRVEVKNLIRQLKETNPFVESNIFKSVENVNLSTVIAYKKDGVKHHFLVINIRKCAITHLSACNYQ